MVQGVGGTGATGSITGTIVYQTYYKMYKEYCRTEASNLGFEAWLTMTGYMNNFTESIENYIETGNEKKGDDKVDSLSIGRHVSNGSTALYQSSDEETFYEFDWESGTYNILKGKEAVAKALGLPDSNDIDTINLGYMKANITNYTFGNLSDGQDSTSQVVYNKYNNVSYINQEFDVDYILNALLMDSSDPQYQIAKGIFDDLCANMGQWLSEADSAELDEVAKEFGTDSAEYKAKLKEVLLANLDQANEWIDEHDHVKNINSGLGPSTDNSTNTDGSGSEDESTTGTVPKYDKEVVIDNAGLAAERYNKWYGSWHTGSSKRDDAKNDSRAHVNEILTALGNQLAAQMGESCTDEIIKYIAKAKDTVLANNSISGDYDYNGRFLAKDQARGEVDNQAVIDAFFSEFNTLCANKGKTSEEVAAEKKLAEEKAAKEKEAYKSIYSMNMSSVAKEAGVNSDKDVQVVNVNSAAEIKAKAEAQILDPIKAQIKSKMAGKGISDADLNTFLEAAADIALADCNDWASSVNNYVYNIDTSRLISKFEDAVKEAIKSKGYEF